jgi:8-oxo-dGTP diphosphatase
VAKPRARWDDDDDLRPLADRGHMQAARLVDQLAPFGASRVLSSPSVRCVDTVVPLAEARGIAVDVEQALAEGNGHRAAKLVLELLDDRADIVMCSHGDVIPHVLDALGFDPDRCAKGSTWVLDGKRARYLEPPA